jgi:hypothetical protein
MSGSTLGKLEYIFLALKVDILNGLRRREVLTFITLAGKKHLIQIFGSITLMEDDLESGGRLNL